MSEKMTATVDARDVGTTFDEIRSTCARLEIEFDRADVEMSEVSSLDRLGNQSDPTPMFEIRATIKIAPRRRGPSFWKHPIGRGSTLSQALACWTAEAESLVGFVRGQEREDGNDGYDAGGMART